jgi:putative membrane protein
MMWSWGSGPIGAGGWIGTSFMVILWIAVVIGIVYLVRYLAHPASHRGQEWPPYRQQPRPDETVKTGSDAMRTLEERYARGDINRDEFLKRRADLTA